jgi:putative restriction endonuclease
MNRTRQTTDAQILEPFAAIRTWERRDQRAPHKILLLLMALAQLQRREGRWLSYAEVEPKLKQLLADFGPPRQTARPEYPFWRLQHDGIWEIPEADRLEKDLTASGDVKVRALRTHGAKGGFTEALVAVLRRRPPLVNRIAALLLENNFPSSLHQQILDAVDFPWVTGQRSRRDPGFRTEILRIYEHRCAVCGYDARLGSSDLGLEAAHIKWHAAGGPDTPDNGLALCPFHHLALDRGALSLDDELTVLISKDVHGQNHLEDLLLRYAGKLIRRPQQGEPSPNSLYLQWHRREVFWAPARKVSE